MNGRHVVRMLGGAVVAVSLAAAVFAAQDIIVYPNPWIPEDARPTRGNLTDGITFAGVPSSGEILVYTVSGTQVRRIAYENSAGAEKWNGRNDDGDYVASGVYLWVVKGGDRTRTGKVVVVR